MLEYVARWCTQGSQALLCVLQGCDAKDGRSTLSMEEMALTAAVLSEGSISNTIAYSSISGDATACDQQYNRSVLATAESTHPSFEGVKSA